MTPVRCRRVLAGRPVARRDEMSRMPRPGAGPESRVRPSWHDWRFELVPRRDRVGLDSVIQEPPRGRPSTGDGRADPASDADRIESAIPRHPRSRHQEANPCRRRFAPARSAGSCVSSRRPTGRRRARRGRPRARSRCAAASTRSVARRAPSRRASAAASAANSPAPVRAPAHRCQPSPHPRSRRRAVDGPHERAAHDPMTGSLDFDLPRSLARGGVTWRCSALSTGGTTA